MARLARVVVPGIPYHLTHRGNHRANVFFCDEDRRAWLDELAAAAQRFQMLLWGYCLMSNHIHLLALPRQKDSLARAMGLAQREYAWSRGPRIGPGAARSPLQPGGRSAAGLRPAVPRAVAPPLGRPPAGLGDVAGGRPARGGSSDAAPSHAYRPAAGRRAVPAPVGRADRAAAGPAEARPQARRAATRRRDPRAV